MSQAELEIAITQAVDARNRYCNRSGFSAHQRVFGSSLRLPACLLSDDPIDRFAVAMDPSTDFHRTAEIRSAATKALFKQMDNEAIHRAAIARSRLPQRDDLQNGTVVYVWRSNNKIRGWVGPGVVVCVNQAKTSAWISMRGVVVKCSMDRIRRATDEEWLGAELIKYCPTMHSSI